MKKWIFSTFLLTLVVSHVNAEIVLYCQSKHFTGIYREESGAWRTTDFKPTRHTFHFSDDMATLHTSSTPKGPYFCRRANTIASYYWLCVGSDLDRETMEILKFKEGVIRISEDSLSSLIFSQNLERYTKVLNNPYSYITNQSDSMGIEAGTCERF